MPEFLPLSAFRQGLLPEDCRSCAWWLTTEGSSSLGEVEAAGRRHEWLFDVEHSWGFAGLLAHEPVPRRGGGSADPVVTGSIHFAPASTLPRFKVLPFPPLPPFSALLFCLKLDGDAPRWAAKRLIRHALHELRRRGVQEVFAVAHRTGAGGADRPACRYFPIDLLADNGFAEVAANGDVVLMCVDNRGLISLADHVESALRRIFSREEEPAPSPVIWAGSGAGPEQGGS